MGPMPVLGELLALLAKVGSVSQERREEGVRSLEAQQEGPRV